MSYLKTLEKAQAEIAADKVYYSILERVGKARWGSQFGDYDKNVVKQELLDMKYSGTKLSDLVIVATADSGGQKAINDAAEDMSKNFPNGYKDRGIRWYTGDKNVMKG